MPLSYVENKKIHCTHITTLLKVNNSAPSPGADKGLRLPVHEAQDLRVCHKSVQVPQWEDAVFGLPLSQTSEASLTIWLPTAPSLLFHFSRVSTCDAGQAHVCRSIHVDVTDRLRGQSSPHTLFEIASSTRAKGSPVSSSHSAVGKLGWQRQSKEGRLTPRMPWSCPQQPHISSTNALHWRWCCETSPFLKIIK